MGSSHPRVLHLASRALQMNTTCNVDALLDKLAPETEDVFDDEFWEVGAERRRKAPGCDQGLTGEC